MGRMLIPPLLLLFLLLPPSWLPVQSSWSDFSIIGYDPDDAGSVQLVEEPFHRWMERYHKVYKNEEEKTTRFQYFLANFEYVAGKGHKVGLNKFADMSNGEFEQVYSGRIERAEGMNKRVGVKREAACLAPAWVDWRRRGVVTGVKNQGSCGMWNYFFGHLVCH